MHFFESGRLIFLWLLPFLFFIFYAGNRVRQTRLAQLGDREFIQKKLIHGISEDARKLGWIFLLLAFFFSILALARPQWGEEKRKVERKGVDIVFLLDTSLSMLAEDVKPNRLGKAKLEIKNMIRKLRGDRVGMVAFAGSSFLQCPLTLDYGAFLLFVDALKPGYIPDPGTSFSNALRLAARAFPADSGKYRSMIVFSDGEDHEGGVDQALEEVKKAGIRVYTLGVGTLEGDPIPLRSGLGQAPGQRPSGYKKDKQGQVVITRLNSELLSRIAKETGGLYLPATPAEREIDVTLKHLETLGQRKLKERLITEREDHFQIFLFFAFLFLIAETALRYSKKRFGMAKAVLPVLILFLFTGFIDTPRSLVEKGNKAVGDKKYQTAVENYRKAQISDPHNPVIRYDLGTALYHQYEYRGAEKELQQALSQARDPQEKARILYNYANTLYRLGDFEKAIENYKKVLEIDPRDEDSKYNLEFLQKKKAQFEKQNQERQKQQKQNPQQNQQQQNQQQQGGQQGEKNKEQSQPQPGDGQDDKQNSQDRQQNKDQQQKNEGNNESQNQQQQDQQSEQEKQKQEGSQKQDDDEGQEQEKEDLEKSEQGTQTKEEEQKDEQSDQPQEPEPEAQQGQPEPQEGDGQEQGQPEPAQPMEDPRQGRGGSKDQPEGQKADQQVSQGGPQPLQGQMGKENALRILDALREGDKQLQDVRHPTRPGNNREILKDW